MMAERSKAYKEAEFREQKEPVSTNKGPEQSLEV